MSSENFADDYVWELMKELKTIQVETLIGHAQNVDMNH